MANLGIGIIGAGNISSTYLRLAPLFRGLSGASGLQRSEGLLESGYVNSKSV